MEARHGLYCHSTELPAVCSLRWQDVGEEHLSQLSEVKEFISAIAKGYVEVRAIFLQGSLLKKLCVLYYRGEHESREVCCLFFYGEHKETQWMMHMRNTFLSCFAYYFNVLHGNFKKLLCDEGCDIHLREKKLKIIIVQSISIQRF